MTVVKIARRTERHTRTGNGAWSRHTTTAIENLELDESVLKPVYERVGANLTAPPRPGSISRLATASLSPGRTASPSTRTQGTVEWATTRPTASRPTAA